MRKDYLNNKKNLPSEVRKVFIIVFVIIIIILLMYFFTTIILAKDNSNENKRVENSIQYGEILAGESFNMKEGEYYVIYYDSSDEYSSIASLISSYQLNNSTTKLYSVDLSNGMNSKYVTNNDIITDSPSSLRVKINTLIKFNNGDVNEVITDIDEITSILSS